MKGCLYGIAGMAMPAPSQLWQGFQSKAPSVRCYRPPFQSSVERGSDNYPFQARRPSVAVEMTEPPLFKQWALVERVMMISVSKQSAAVKWQPFQSNVLAIARLSSRGTTC